MVMKIDPNIFVKTKIGKRTLVKGQSRLDVFFC